VRIIVNDVPPEDFVLVARAVKYLVGQPDKKDAILQYGDVGSGLALYVRRNKSSITVSRVP